MEYVVEVTGGQLEIAMAQMGLQGRRVHIHCYSALVRNLHLPSRDMPLSQHGPCHHKRHHQRHHQGNYYHLSLHNITLLADCLELNRLTVQCESAKIRKNIIK